MTSPIFRIGETERLIPGFSREESHEKFPARRIAHNPLKRLISDERIQGNPRKSNPPASALSHPNGGHPRKPKRIRRTNVGPLPRHSQSA
jgi:hypothetical protein